MKLNRRQFISKSAGVTVATLLGFQMRDVLATPEAAQELLNTYAGDMEVGSGKIKLTAPEIAENGNTVPISFTVDSPMSDDSYVESVMILAEENPLPDVATFHFSPASGAAKASTRMRLAKTQNVIAVAKMNDGSVFMDKSNVKVTIGGCGG